MNRRREFTIGTPVEVLVQKVDLDRREIDFRLLDDASGGWNAGRGSKKTARRMKR